MPETAPVRPFGRSFLRGLAGKCPHCGKGALFYRYLKVSPECPVCGIDLDRYPADDGPAYFTILLVGHLIVAPLLVLSFIWKAPVEIVIPATVIPLVLITLAVLPRTKGAVVGALYAFNVTREDGALHTADRAD